MSQLLLSSNAFCIRVAADEHIPEVRDAMEGGSSPVFPSGHFAGDFFLEAAATRGVGVFLMGVVFLPSLLDATVAEAAAAFGLGSGPTLVFRLFFLSGTGAITVAGAPVVATIPAEVAPAANIAAGGMMKPPPTSEFDIDVLAMKVNPVCAPRTAAAAVDGVESASCATAPTPAPTTGPNWCCVCPTREYVGKMICCGCVAATVAP